MKSHCCSASASATDCEALRALHSRIPTQTGMLQPVSQHLSGHWIQAFVRNNQTRKKRRSKHQIWISDSICCDSFVLTSDSVSHFSLSLILYCLPLFLSRSLFYLSFASFLFLPLTLSFNPLPCLLLNRMSLHCTQDPCFYGSVSKQASQQDTVVQMSRGRSFTQPSEQSNKLNSLSLQSCYAKIPLSHLNFSSGKHCWDKHVVKERNKPET